MSRVQAPAAHTSPALRARVASRPHPQPLHLTHHAGGAAASLAASVSAGHSHLLHSTNGHTGHTGGHALKCPELLLRGVELQTKAPLERLEKKGKRFESPWHEYHVALFAGVLFYYDDLRELPRGIVPLAGCAVKAVDRIFKNSDPTAARDSAEAAPEQCGPCFKVTSSAHRVLLFRCDSDATRTRWIRDIQSASGGTGGEAAALGSTTSSHASQRSHASSEDASSLDPAPSRAAALARFSLDETQSRRSRGRRGTPPGSNGSFSSQHDAADSEPAAADTEISQMLRDAMAMVKKQKLEIQELRRALEEARSAARASSIATRPSETDELHAHSAALVAPSNESIPKVVDERGAVVDTEVTPTPVAQPPTPAPSQPTPPVAPVAESTAPASVEPNATDYLQKQAMELAEIARYLQLTFQNDVLAATKQINSANSSSPTEMLDHVSSTSSTYSDHPSEVEDYDSDGDRLSEFEEADAKFLESNGMLDSIHKVMRDFSSPSDLPRAKSEQFIINDDIIAEIRQGADKKREAFNLMDPNALRSLRSQSACDEPTDYKLSLSPQSIARTHSAREFSIDDFSSPAPSSKHRKRIPKDLGVLVVEDNMAVVSSILQTASRDEKTALLLPLVRLFHRHYRLSRLIRWAIESEVASVMNVATLFRSDDYASRLVSTYSKAVGSNFIKVALGKPIQDIYKLNLADIDLTPSVFEEDQDPELIKRNAGNLMSACQIVLDSIIANKSSIPSSYFHICSHLNAKVISRFDGSMEGLAVEDPASLTRSVIGGFLFLRFVCPAITTPHLHDLVDKEPAPETRKILVLVTKLIFKTATSVLFNEKEAHLRVLNPFIERNSPGIQQLFYELAIAPSESIEETFAADSQSMLADLPSDQPELDVAVIRTIATKNLDEIERKLSVSGCSPTTVENLRFSLESMRGDESAFASKGQRSKRLNLKFLNSFSKIVRKQSDV